MKFTEEEQTNEAGGELQRDQTSPFDDIYVPGIGVRGALGDDPESTQWRRLRAGCSCGAAFVSRATRWALENIGRAGSRLPVALTNIHSEIRTTIACWLKLLVHLTKSCGRGLRETERYLASRILSPVRQLRSARRNRLSPASSILTRTLEEARSQLLGAKGIARVQIHRSSNYRLSLPPIPVTVLRNSHRAQSVLRSAVVGARNRLRVTLDYPRLWISANYKPELTKLWRAAPALLIMLAMIVFVIQEVAVIVKR